MSNADLTAVVARPKSNEAINQVAKLLAYCAYSNPSCSNVSGSGPGKIWCDFG